MPAFCSRPTRGPAGRAGGIGCEPLAERRWLEVPDWRIAVDWARQTKTRVDGRYSEAQRIVLVVDNPNSHGRAHQIQAAVPHDSGVTQH